MRSAEWSCCENSLLSEHEQRVCNLRSALLSLIRYFKRLLSQWINSDKVAFLESVAEGVEEALSAGASRLLAWGGKKNPRPHSRKCADVSIAQSFEEIANTIQGHVASVECAKFMFLEALAQQHNCRPVIDKGVGVPVVLQQQVLRCRMCRSRWKSRWCGSSTELWMCLWSYRRFKNC